MGQVSARGTFMNLYLNGKFKGYYNPTERIDSDFLNSWHGTESNRTCRSVRSPRGRCRDVESPQERDAEEPRRD